MPIGNRVTPPGEIVGVRERGTLMGNRRLRDGAAPFGRPDRYPLMPEAIADTALAPRLPTRPAMRAAPCRTGSRAQERAAPGRKE